MSCPMGSVFCRDSGADVLAIALDSIRGIRARDGGGGRHLQLNAPVMRTTSGVPHVSCILIFLNGAPFIDEAIASVVHQAGFDDWELDSRRRRIHRRQLGDGQDLGGDRSRSDPLRRARPPPEPRHERVPEPRCRHGTRELRGLPRLRRRLAAVGSRPPDPSGRGVSRGRHRRRGHVALAQLDRRRRRSGSGSPHDAADRAPPYTVLQPSGLFSAIYGIPGGGQVPAMCSLLVRREALLTLGGLEAQFRGLYEDQVLYVKAGLRLAAVIDPRPLALYRQHPGSACEVSIAEGTWSREGPSAAATGFYAWMQSYVSRETGSASEESAIAGATSSTTAPIGERSIGTYASGFAARRQSRSSSGPRSAPTVELPLPQLSRLLQWSVNGVRNTSE